jgi:hypothetical protein
MSEKNEQKLCPFRNRQQNPAAFRNEWGQSWDWIENTMLPCLQEKCAMWHGKIEPLRDDEGFPDPGGKVISTGYCGLAGKP